VGGGHSRGLWRGVIVNKAHRGQEIATASAFGLIASAADRCFTCPGNGRPWWCWPHVLAAETGGIADAVSLEPARRKDALMLDARAW